MNSAARPAGSAPGDPAVIRAVNQRYLRPVYSVTFAILRDAGLAERATGETFVRAWATADLGRGDRALGPWLCSVARRVAAELQRTESTIGAAMPAGPGPGVGPIPEQRSQSPAAAAQSAAPSPRPSVQRTSRIWAVREALDLLPGMDRELIRLRHNAGLSPAEIAEILDLPVSAVIGRSFRAHRRLDRLLRQSRTDGADEHAGPVRWFERSIQRDPQFQLVPESCA